MVDKSRAGERGLDLGQKMRKGTSQLAVIHALVCALLFFASSASGQTFIWDAGAGADVDWDATTNWNPTSAAGGPNGTGVTVEFGSAGTTADVNLDRAVGTIVFNRDADFSITGESGDGISLDAGIVAGSPTATARVYTFGTSEDLTLTNNNVWNVAANTTLSVTTRVNDSGSTFSLTKTGNGTLTLGSTTNGFDGGLFINGGVVQVAAVADAAAESTLGHEGGLTINGGTLRFNGTGTNGDTTRLFTVGTSGATLDASGTGSMSFDGAGNLVMSGTTNRTLTFTGTSGSTVANSFTPVIVDSNPGGAGNTSVVKSGSNRWTLVGSHSYEGTTTVSGGTLLLSASSNNSIPNSSKISIASGATLNVLGLTSGSLNLGSTTAQTIGGNGSVVGNVRVASGSTVTPGESAGKLTFGGDITLVSGATLEVELGAPTTPGVTYDQIEVANSGSDLTTGGATLKLIALPGVTAGTYTIITTSASGNINFAGLFARFGGGGLMDDNVNSYTQGGLTFKIDYSASSVNVIVSSTPEPGSMGLIALGGAALLRRRRRV